MVVGTAFSAGVEGAGLKSKLELEGGAGLKDKLEGRS